MPITERVETRKYGDSITHYPMPYLSPQSYWFYREAYDIDMFKMLDLMAVIQRHVDQSISTTLFVDSDTTDGDMARYYIYAHELGLKTIYYARTKIKSIEVCSSCEV